MLELILCLAWSISFAALFGSLSYWLVTDDDNPRAQKSPPGN